MESDVFLLSSVRLPPFSTGLELGFKMFPKLKDEAIPFLERGAVGLLKISVTAVHVPFFHSPQ